MVTYLIISDIIEPVDTNFHLCTLFLEPDSFVVGMLVTCAFPAVHGLAFSPDGHILAISTSAAVHLISMDKALARMHSEP
jgi:hypothetical protein